MPKKSSMESRLLGPARKSKWAKNLPEVSRAILDGIKEKYLDIPYCDESASQCLDLYLPSGSKGPYPVVVHFHGGAFVLCDKRDVLVAPMLRGIERGYAVISAEYRKTGEARFPAMVYDAKTVIRWVRANAGKYNLDSERIAVWGPSSGGWLASYISVTNDNPAFENLEQGNAGFSSHVHACIDWCGPCGGFLDADKQFLASGIGEPVHNSADSPESTFLGARITKIPELVRLANPCVHVREDVVPFLILHGSADPVVPVEQSVALYEAIEKIAGPGRARLHIAEGQLHHNANSWYEEAWVGTLCYDFLDEVFGRK